MADITLVHPLAEAYAAKYTSAEPTLLSEINRTTYANHPHAHMLSGHVQGRFLSMISCMLQPKYILEVGTFTGYSALCLAEGLTPEGELHTIEIREEDAKIARENFINTKSGKQITLHTGNALDILPKLPYNWDLVFIDADKTSYLEYFQIILPRLSANGIILVDNVLFHGQVLTETVKGKNALAIDAFNNYIMNDTRVQQVLLTIRDGLLMIKKK